MTSYWMRISMRAAASIILVLALAHALPAYGAKTASYTVVTREGQVIHVQAKPEVRGLQAFMRLAPSGRLAVIQEELIDWARTEAANLGPSIAVPADARLAREAEPKQDSPTPIDVKITGSSAPRGDAVATGEKPQVEAVAAGKPTVDQKEVVAKEKVVQLQKEFARVSATRDAASARKSSLEAELAEIQSKGVGYASDQSPAARKIRELQQQLAATNEEINRCETRLGSIRAEVVSLGGTID